jgi:hypothetical protein
MCGFPGIRPLSGGKAMALDFPGAARTEAFAINDNGTIVRFYTKTALPGAWRHGFIYSNGQWAKLDFPSKLETELTGISDSNLIIGGTIKSSFETGTFLYKNGTFKKSSCPRALFRHTQMQLVRART